MAVNAVGIDLGTSNSCVAVARDGKVTVLRNAHGETTTASVVAYGEDGSVLVGNAAKANIIHDPLHTVSSTKRLIGRYFFSAEVGRAQAICSYEITEGPNHDVRLRVRNQEHSLPEVSAMVLAEMKRIAEDQLGEPVTQAVITVPAYFNDNQRQATKDAGTIAGLEALRILNEPTAAALAYGFGRGLEQTVAVYDLGGGTFDISVLRIGKDIFEVLSTCGDTFLGGDDFDDRIIDLLADEFVEQEGINLRTDPFALQKLKTEAERAKMSLSEDEETRVYIRDIVTGTDGEPRSIDRMLTRSDLSSLIMDLIMRTLKVCDEALQQADMTVRNLDGVILVGGPTRLPVVRQAVKDYFQQEPQANVDPDEVVAMGAAIHAAALTDSTQDSILLDITPHDLRIGVAGGLADVVIERNTPLPIEQTRSFTTFKDFQESVRIRVYQGEEVRGEDNEMLGEFEFSGFEKEKRGEVSIAVTFEINADGIVNVTAADPKSGQRASTRITFSSGLSDSELDNIVQQDPTARVRADAEPPPPGVASALPDPTDDLAGPAESPTGPAESSTGPVADNELELGPRVSQNSEEDLFASDLGDFGDGNDDLSMMGDDELLSLVVNDDLGSGDDNCETRILEEEAQPTHVQGLDAAAGDPSGGEDSTKTRSDSSEIPVDDLFDTPDQQLTVGDEDGSDEPLTE